MIYLVFFFGILTGSFLNVVICRLKNGRNIIFGRSFCPKCEVQLRWHDLIPLLSFIHLGGRCRYCREKISWQYPIVEILSGLIWIGVFYKVFGNFSAIGGSPEGGQFLNPLNLLNFFYYIFIFSALLVIAAYDFRWKIIPDKVIYPAIVAALVFNFFKLLNFETFLYSLLTACAAFLFFFLIFYFSNGRAMGLGDAKLALLIGLFLTPPLAVTAFLLAFIIGAIFGIILIGFGKKTLKSQIAFGPFMVLGTLIAFLFFNFIFKFLKF